MNLPDRLAITRTACQTAIESPPLSEIEEFLERRGISTVKRIQLLRNCAAIQAATPELTGLQEAITTKGVATSDSTAFARALIVRASIVAVDKLPTLRVDDSVMHLFCNEFLFYATADAAARQMFAITGYPFIAMSKIALLDRFPGGQQQWEISGFPRRWLGSIRPSMLPEVAWFMATKVRAFSPYFVSHMAVTRQKARFLLEREYFKSFYRMAAAIEKQPSIRAIMGSSWLHSLETHRVSPHLAFLNRPHLEAGGIYIDIGPARQGEGFLAGDQQRAALYLAGTFKPTIGVVICTREQAIAWKKDHLELERYLSVP